jgi:hypothetical protein
LFEGPDLKSTLAFQHGRQLHHQHQLAELRRRIDHVVSLADGGAGQPEFLFRRGGHRHCRGAGARHRAHCADTVGNFWVDLVRITYYLLLPICLVFAIFLISQGMIQNFKPYDAAP